MARAYTPLPEPETLWELFDYKPLTGELVWKARTSNRVKPGDTVGRLQKNGYKTVGVLSKVLLQHRLIWCWVTGTDPVDKQVDHANGNPIDNRWFNLRLATHSQNSCNSKMRVTNRSKVKGVKLTPTGTYQARIRHNHKTYYLGTFTTAEAAGAAYSAAAIGLHGKFAQSS
jgi:hypothetical protein